VVDEGKPPLKGGGRFSWLEEAAINLEDCGRWRLNRELIH